jgi:hypothetical protein
MNEPMDIGPRKCGDCKVAVPPPKMLRCGECLLKRIDRLQRRAKAA